MIGRAEKPQLEMRLELKVPFQLRGNALFLTCCSPSSSKV